MFDGLLHAISLLKESFDFKKIFTSIKLTAQQNLNKQN